MTKGERDEEEEEGGGRGMAVTSCIDRMSTTEMELPAAKARRPEPDMSAAPPLLRPGGPGIVDSHGGEREPVAAIGGGGAGLICWVFGFFKLSGLGLKCEEKRERI